MPQVAEPFLVFGGGVFRHVQASKIESKRRILASPIQAYERFKSTTRIQRFGIFSVLPTPAIGTDQNQMAYSLRVPYGICNRRRSALRDPHECKPFKASCVHHRFK